MSTQNPRGGYMLPVIIVILGIVGLFVYIFFIAFVALLGYYLYRLDKRLSDLEGNTAGKQPKPKQD
jgi:hypothetical protein